MINKFTVEPIETIYTEVGQPITFKAEASVEAAFEFQVRREGRWMFVGGTQGSSFTLGKVGKALGTHYRVIARSDGHAVASNVAEIIFGEEPEVVEEAIEEVVAPVVAEVLEEIVKEEVVTTKKKGKKSYFEQA